MACSVEYAQSQNKPRRATGGKHAPKPDLLAGTIENDQHYKQFLAELAAPVQPPSADVEAPMARGLTPLLAAIKQRDLQKFAEKMAHKNKKRKRKQGKSAAATAASTAAPAANAPSKRKRNKKKKNKNKPAAAESGPQFGAVKILGASSANNAASSSSTANSHRSTPQVTTPSTATPNKAEGKKPRKRKPKVKKTGAAKKTAPNATPVT